jgi:2-methylcitrate dehydratase PrpD
VEAVAREVASGEAATIIGGGRLSRIGAALLNGYQVTAVTVCDVYRPSLCHVTPEVVPPALAVAEGRGVSGRELITALAVGLETTVRVGRGIRYPSFRERGWHSPGVIGPFGGAVSAGRVLGLDAEQMRWALGLAGAQAAGTFAQWGTPTIKFHQAHGAVAGLLAATLARERFRSSDEILVHPDGGTFNAYSDGGDPEAVTEDLGADWELERISMRLWPTASSIQSVVTGVFDLIASHDLRPEQVRRMSIRLSEPTYRLHGEMGWDDRFRALLSTRYTAAVVLHDRECWLEQFDAERIADPMLHEFATRRIEVVADPDVPLSGAAIEVEMEDGRRITAVRDVPRGDADDPLRTDDVAGKFRRAARGILPDRRIEEALERFLAVEESEDVGSLLVLLAAPEPARTG